MGTYFTKHALADYQKTSCEASEREFKTFYGNVLNANQRFRAFNMARDWAQAVKEYVDPTTLELYEDETITSYKYLLSLRKKLEGYIIGVIDSSDPSIIRGGRHVAASTARRMTYLLLHMALCEVGFIDGAVDWPLPRFDVKRRDAIAIKPDALARLFHAAGHSSVNIMQLEYGFGLKRSEAVMTADAFAELTANAVHFEDVRIGECFWVESEVGIQRFVKYNELGGNNSREIYGSYAFFADDAPVKRATVKRISIDGGYHFCTPAEAIKQTGHFFEHIGDIAYMWPFIKPYGHIGEDLLRKGWELILASMDPAVRSYVESESKLPGFSINTDEAFLTRYLQLAYEDLIIDQNEVT